MSIILKNEFLTVKVEAKGAEIISIMDNEDGSEYIWKGESKYWGRHAPILFPIVGKVKENTYKIEEKEYQLSQHGFARDLNFDIVESNNDRAALKLKWSEETLKNYPYKFELAVEYSILESTLEVNYIVKNVDQDNIYFSIGAHPGFNCPFEDSKATSFEDYYFKFEKKEDAKIIPINNEGLLKKEQQNFINNNDIIRLTKDLFNKDALIFQKLKSKKISLMNDKDSKSIIMDFEGFPYLGLWSKPEGAPFVCIEPWFGHADYEDFEEDFRKKEGVLKLNKGEEFKCKYSISIKK